MCRGEHNLLDPTIATTKIIHSKRIYIKLSAYICPPCAEVQEKKRRQLRELFSHLQCYFSMLGGNRISRRQQANTFGGKPYNMIRYHGAQNFNKNLKKS